eukprot:scaffold31794_cov107-Isochrysis_galbana.AAC.1
MRLTIAWGAPSAGVAKRMRMAWCLRAAGVRGNTKGSSNALSVSQQLKMHSWAVSQGGRVPILSASLSN